MALLNGWSWNHLRNIFVLCHLAQLTKVLLANDNDEQSSLTTAPKRLLIGGLFELSNRLWSTGQSELETALLAIKHVNQRRIIPHYELKLVHKDTATDSGQATNMLYEILYGNGEEHHTVEPILMIIGSAWSKVTETLAQIAAAEDLIQISFAATSPALSARAKYPTFFRLCEADSTHNHARARLMAHLGWDKVATLTENDELYRLKVEKLERNLEANGIVVKKSAVFDDAEELTSRLKELKSSNVRIIFGKFSEEKAKNVFCQAYHLGMVGTRKKGEEDKEGEELEEEGGDNSQPRLVWILSQDYTSRWWTRNDKVNCTVEQLESAVEGYFAVGTLTGKSRNKRADPANITYTEFEAMYKNMNYTQPISQYAAQTYDTVWTVALALKNLLRQYRNTSLATVNRAQLRNDLMSIIENMQFRGISGHVRFDGSDRVGDSAVYQNQNQDNLQLVAKMLTASNHVPNINASNHSMLCFYCDGCQPVIWPNNGSCPVDEFMMILVPRLIFKAAFYTISGFCTIGIILGFLFLIFNWKHRKVKYIKLSSPKLNNVAVLGSIFIYSAIVLFGMDDNVLTVKLYKFICPLKVILAAAGFTFQFGAIFVKTFRVFIIFHHANKGLLKKKLLRDTQLLTIIGVLFLVDMAMLGLWVTFDPMDRSTVNITEMIYTKRDFKHIPQQVLCSSRHSDKFITALITYKSGLLIFGVYMAWATRHVQIAVLNDSKFIGFSVYNVVLAIILVLVLFLTLKDQPTQFYMVASVILILSTTGTLLLLFLPKIYDIWKSGGRPSVKTSSFFDEANTRRLPGENKHDLMYRAEVQNRHYRLELATLIREALRLQALIDSPIESYHHAYMDLSSAVSVMDKDWPYNCHQRNYLASDYEVSSSGDSNTTNRETVTYIRPDENEMSDDQTTVLTVNVGQFHPPSRKSNNDDSGIYTLSFKSNKTEVFPQHTDVCKHVQRANKCKTSHTDDDDKFPHQTNNRKFEEKEELCNLRDWSFSQLEWESRKLAVNYEDMTDDKMKQIGRKIVIFHECHATAT